MRSFAQSHSFLLAAILFCLVTPPRIFGGVAAVEASEISQLNHSDSVQHGISSLKNGRRRRHSEISDVLAVSRGTDIMLYPGRRAAGATFTHFTTGLGACGHFNVATDFIVAISRLQYEGGKHCGETITITAKGKTAQATIMDECMGCAFNDIDLTDGLYRFFDPTMFGTFTGDWEFGSGGPAAKPPPTSSKKPVPPTTTTTTTSSKVHPTTTSKKTSSNASTSTITSATSQNSSSSAIASATASTSPTPVPAAGNLGNLFDALINMGGLIVQTVPSSS